MLYWEKHDYDRNIHRWYCVTYGRDLLGDLVLTKTWGALGRRSRQEKKLLLQTGSDLREWLHRIGLQRDSEGYGLEVRPVFSVQPNSRHLPGSPILLQKC